jgi:hypothetical protein
LKPLLGSDRDYLQVPLPLHFPEQQSAFELQGSPLSPQLPSQTSPGAQLGVPSALLQFQLPSAQQV